MKICPTCGVEYGDEQKFCPEDGSALRSTQQGDLVGGVVAERYHILKKLGEGGMGAVYLGEHVKMGRKSAIKVMSAQMANDAEAIARFNREAANAARITHPNVCAIYDFGETADGLIYLAMEFIEGGSLGDVLDREGAISPKRAATILAQTADALQAAHDLDIVHRDLKPDNIMLARGRDGADIVKVVDFGIAKAMTGEEGQKVTKTGLVVGTPEYMSPEQLSGDVLDGRSDIYSLALVFYRMVTGTLPFDADSAQEMMIKRLTDEPRSLGAVRPDLGAPPALEDALRRALQRMPGDRYTSAVEFARDVSRAIEGMAGAATSGISEAATQIMSGPPDTDPGLTPTRVGTAQRASPGAPSTPTTPRPHVAPPTAPRKKVPVLAIAAVAVLLLGGGTTAVVKVLASKGGTDGTVALDSTSEGDTANGGQGAIQTDHRRQRRTDNDTAGTTPAESAGPQPPAVDTTAVARELDDLFLGLPDAGPAAPPTLVRLDEIMNDMRLSAGQRATAAAYAAQAYFQGGDQTRACARIREALRLDPGSSTYQSTLTNFQCGT